VTSKPASLESRDPNRIALLLPRRDGWTAVAVERRPDGWRYTAQHAAGIGLDIWLNHLGTGRVIAVLPPRETVCRTFSLPAASPDQLELALRLQAEAVLLGGVPPHRVGLGILPGAADAKSRQGLVLAWPESMATADLPDIPAGVPTTFVPELACLAALAVSDGPCSGITMAADQSDGSVVLIVPTGGELAIRSTREDGSEPETWRSSLLRAARETLMSSDLPPSAAESMIADFSARIDDGEAMRTIVVPEETERLVARTLAGAEELDASARTTVAGVLLALDGPLVPFTRLLREIPRERPHPIQAALDRLSEPRLAARLLIAAVLVAMLAPLAFASLRYGILSLKVDDLDALERSNRITRQQVAMYRELRSNAWPMGKVLGDLANAMPEGIDVETISIGQSEGVTVRGVAKPTDIKLAGDKKESLDAAEVVGRMQQDLEGSGIFRRAKYEFKAEDGRGWREFTMTCEVTAPTRQPPYTADEDFAVRTLRDRRYPNWREIEGADAGGGAAPDSALAAGDLRPRTPSPPSDAGEDESGSEEDSGEGAEDSDEVAVVAEGETGDAGAAAAAGSSRGIGRRPTAPRPSDGSGTATPPQPTAGVNVEVPPPMTDEEIAGLSKSDALALLNRVAKARQSPSIDQDTKNRLRTDFDRLMQHIRKAP
jgi:hypothetical protein